ncbi:SNF1-related protein kinase regulatory subunit gamma-1-like [Senna tora]|uniref:SNF1-related protein kinase regulatory subunit gamma-1-like n=1 Tax=Senna tora TaxID=362788 RepID=A0A834SUP1_9FABA|nr:SNF1-related protein kinase regulatory subunit gamma-1-like [Senna tora]
MQEIAHEAKQKSAILNNNKSSDEKQFQVDTGSALQQFLDRIPISSISGFQSSFGWELKAGDSVKDAIHMLYDKDVFGAPIADVFDPNSTSMKFSYRYIGFIDFPSMVLWCLEEYENIRKNSADKGREEKRNSGFFSTMDQIPQIGQTKVSELVKLFLWEPFFPIRMDDSLLHALLLLSKHRLHVLPVVQQSDPQVIGLVTQNALGQLLLQSTGLEWFDSIADKALSNLEIENQEQASYVFGNQTVADALHLLWKKRTCAVAVLDPQSKKLIGSVRYRDVYHLVENDDLFRNRKTLTVGEFIHSETDPPIELDNEASLIARSLHLKKSFMPRMDSPLTCKKNDTLKQLMQNMTERNSRFSFLIDDNEGVIGLITMRHIILQFAPPCVSSSINGGGFFELALEQSGCQVRDGTLVCNH